jgi:hypothetical protein
MKGIENVKEDIGSKNAKHLPADRDISQDEVVNKVGPTGESSEGAQ